MLHALIFIFGLIVVYGTAWFGVGIRLCEDDKGLAHIPALFISTFFLIFSAAILDNVSSPWVILERFNIIAYTLLMMVGSGWGIFQLTNTDAREKWRIRSLKKKLKREEERRYRQQLIAGLEESIDKLYDRDLNEVLELTK